MRERFSRWLADHQAVIMCFLWFVWDALTAFAYLETSPPQLQRVENFIHMPIWIVWAFKSMLLLIGVLIPVSRGESFREIAIYTRGAGLALSALLLALWGAEFVLSDADRGWVSGKNYLMLGILAVHYGYLVSRYSVREG